VLVGNVPEATPSPARSVIVPPGLRNVFGMAAPPVAALAFLPSFAVAVWGGDEVRRWLLRRRREGSACQ
jgi:hypothetical protein